MKTHMTPLGGAPVASSAADEGDGELKAAHQ
jgi:hypothetical protein